MTKMIERVQTGIRIEKRLLKVLKGLAEHLDISLAELIVLSGNRNVALGRPVTAFGMLNSPAQFFFQVEFGHWLGNRLLEPFRIYRAHVFPEFPCKNTAAQTLCPSDPL